MFCVCVVCVVYVCVCDTHTERGSYGSYVSPSSEGSLRKLSGRLFAKIVLQLALNRISRYNSRLLPTSTLNPRHNASLQNSPPPRPSKKGGERRDTKGGGGHPCTCETFQAPSSLVQPTHARRSLAPRSLCTADYSHKHTDNTHTHTHTHTHTRGDRWQGGP